MRTSVAIRGVAAAVVASGQAGHVSSSITSVIIIIIIIIITRPKPPYGRQGLAGLWGKNTVRRVHFGFFLTSHFATSPLSSDWIVEIRRRSEDKALQTDRQTF